MDITSVHKYISLSKLANKSVEVSFSGQKCLTVSEGMMGNIWSINPVFAKLVYGANIFEDIPQCKDAFGTTEEAVAAGLVQLYELGAFNTEVDFPEDTYAATIHTVSEDILKHSIKTTNNLVEAHFKNFSILKSIQENTFPRESSNKDKFDYLTNMAQGKIDNRKPKSCFYLKDKTGKKISKHDTEVDALKCYKAMPDNYGVKIIKEDTDFQELEILIVEDGNDDKYDKWESEVRKANSGKNLKFKNRIEKGLHTTSAEESGKDRSYAVWDHDKNIGHIFNEASVEFKEKAIIKEPEKEESKELVSAIKKDKKFTAKGQDAKLI